MIQTVYKNICCLMVVILFAIAVKGYCSDAHAEEHPSIATADACACAISAMEEQQCPSCPAGQHAVPDDCDSSCNCPCHAPLISPFPQLVSQQPVSPLLFIEPFKALPEVYLSKFIPPQNLA